MKRYLALSLLTLTLVGCDAMTAHTDVVARAGQQELTVDEVLELTASNPQIPARAAVVRQIADLWVDYTVLATLVAEDSTLNNLAMEPLLRGYVEQETYAQLRDQVMTADTLISDEELAELYAQQAPGVRLKARHILLSVPGGATEAQRDSVMALAGEIRERAVSGADFSELARQYSEDQGSARQGGDLGWFERGRMVQPFEEAAFQLEVGQVSEVVETPFGLHIIKLDDREVPSLDDVAEDFRQQIKSERRQASLDAYIESLEAPYEFEVAEGAEDVVRELAEDPSSLSGRAASRALVTWEDGAVTAGEVAALFREMQPPQRMQIADIPQDEQLTQMVRDVATNELILADAESRGITVPQAQQDSIGGLIKDRVLQLAQSAGLTGAPEPGETVSEAVERRVNSFLNAIISGQTNVMPMGSLSGALREQHETRINQAAIENVVRRMEERRSETSSGPEEAPVPPTRPQMQMPDAPAGEGDTTG